MGGGLRTDPNDLAHDLMSYIDRELGLPPATSEGVDITSAYTTCFERNFNIALTERLWFGLQR